MLLKLTAEVLTNKTKETENENKYKTKETETKKEEEKGYLSFSKMFQEV